VDDVLRDQDQAASPQRLADPDRGGLSGPGILEERQAILSLLDDAGQHE
jgi:hypothetical protein